MNKTEKKTIGRMVEIFCNDNHGKQSQKLCPQCSQLLEYALDRLEKCPHKDSKPPCSKCEIHCYKPEMREKITEVMTYSGPKMFRKSPLLAIRHLIKSCGAKRNPNKSKIN